MTDDSGPPEGEYRTGYRQPPLATRFKPGVSGNPNGRPKADKSTGRIIRDALKMRVPIKGGRPGRSVSAREAMIRTLVASAVRADFRALRLTLALEDRYGESAETALDPAHLAADDAALLRDYLAKVGSPDAGAESRDPGSGDTGTEGGTSGEDGLA